MGFLEAEQKARFVQEQELREAQEAGLAQNQGASFEPMGRIFLPHAMVSAVTYWTNKRMDVQAIVARRGAPTLFVTVTVNVWRKELSRLGLDTKNRGVFTAAEDKSRPFDRPDSIA